MAEFDKFDDELDEALRIYKTATPPAGMEARVLARAEEQAKQSARRNWFLLIAPPIGALALIALVVVTVQHRNSPQPNQPHISIMVPRTQLDAPQPNRAPSTPSAHTAERSAKVLASSADTHPHPHLPVEVLGGAPTQQELLLMQMVAQSQAHPEVKEILDPEVRAKDLAQMKQEFENFLNSGNKTGDETP